MIILWVHRLVQCCSLLCHEELWAPLDSPKFISSCFCTSEGPRSSIRVASTCGFPHPFQIQGCALFSCQPWAVANSWGCSEHPIHSFSASSCWRTPDNETEGKQVQNCHKMILSSMQGWAWEEMETIAVTKTSHRKWRGILIWILIILVSPFCKCTDNSSVLSCRDKDIILK